MINHIITIIRNILDMWLEGVSLDLEERASGVQ